MPTATPSRTTTPLRWRSPMRPAQIAGLAWWLFAMAALLAYAVLSGHRQDATLALYPACAAVVTAFSHLLCARLGARIQERNLAQLAKVMDDTRLHGFADLAEARMNAKAVVR